MTKDEKELAAVSTATFLLGIVVTTLLAILVWPYSPPPPKYSDLLHSTQPSEPIQLLIHGERWNLFVGNNAERMGLLGELGETQCETHHILVAGGLDRIIQRETVIHEMLHAQTCDEKNEHHNDYFNSLGQDGPHPGIDKIATVIATFGNDNPELAPYLFNIKH